MGKIEEVLELTRNVDGWENNSTMISDYNPGKLIKVLVDAGIPIDPLLSLVKNSYRLTSGDYFLPAEANLPVGFKLPANYQPSISGLLLRTGRIKEGFTVIGELEVKLTDYLEQQSSTDIRDPLLIRIGPASRTVGVYGKISFEGDVSRGGILVAKTRDILTKYHNELHFKELIATLDRKS